MSDEKKLAVLIDSDNVSAKYAQFIMSEVTKYGTPTYKRVYGDWEKGGNGWHDPAINYSIMPIQQTCYIAGKNATDFSMIIDAMDILYTGNADGFCIVTSDSDFTRLAIRLREAGKLVIGIGELKTPRAFTVSCHHFCYLNSIGEQEDMPDEKTLRKAVVDYVEEHAGERIDLAKLSAVLTSRFGNVNFNELGFKRFSNYIDSFRELKRSNTFVSLTPKLEKKAPVAVPAEYSADDIAAAIAEYLNTHAPQNDNMIKLESYLNSRFGKIDYSRFGSKRFARFIDKRGEFLRDGTSIILKPAAAEQAVEKLSCTAEKLAEEALGYAGAMPLGANVGQFNNMMIEKYGKNYAKDAGYAGFRSALNDVAGLSFKNNMLYVIESAETAPVTETAPEPPKQSAALETRDIKPEITAAVVQYAKDNMPSGGNIGQLNNVLMQTLGKDYMKVGGYADFHSVLESVGDVSIRKNRAYYTGTDVLEVLEVKTETPAAETTETVQPKTETSVEETVESLPESSAETAVNVESSAAEIIQSEEKPAKPRRRRGRKPRAAETSEAADAAETAANAETPVSEISADKTAETTQTTETQTAEKSETVSEETPAEQPAKPDRNALRRDILNHAAQAENGISLAALGIVLTEKYGKDYFKTLGYSTMRKLISEVEGVEIRDSKVHISSDFMKRTEEIETFVSEFVKNGGGSVKALSGQLRKRFENFDFRIYGFEKFTDFLNEIDGVSADRYRVRPSGGDK